MHLMQTCERYVNIEKFTPENPLELLKQSYEEIMHHRKSILGSSTACVVILNKDKCTVYTSNIGDSGFIIIRKGEVILRSREQQHYFNTPFQLSIPPPSYRNNVLIDQPDVAQNAHVRVENGDVILLASDGVFDNLPDDLIITEMSKVEGSSNAVQIQTTANSIAWMSRCLSYDQSFLSPFSKNAFSNGILRPGKYCFFFRICQLKGLLKWRHFRFEKIAINRNTFGDLLMTNIFIGIFFPIFIFWNK